MTGEAERKGARGTDCYAKFRFGKDQLKAVLQLL